MKVKFIILISVIVWMYMPADLLSQVIASLSVEAGAHNRFNTPVCINLDAYTSLPDSVLRLEEITGNQRKPVPVQVEAGRERKLWWIINGELKAGAKRRYELVKGIPFAGQRMVSAKASDGALVLSVESKNVLQYNYKTVFPPEGVSPYYKRSGFIHPLWSPQGAVLTNIQPKDHYHHYGIWNPWTETEFEGHEIDFWNLGRRLGTVRFVSFASVVDGPVFGGFKALHDHIVYPDSAEKTAMKEIWDVRVYNLPSNAYLWEFTSTLNLATPSPLKLKEYRYGGFGMRATAEWTNQNSKALTSEGKTRVDADGSRAKWGMISGETSKGEAGVLFMSYPSNFNFPEPIRMLPLDSNGGRGDVFFNFCPTKNMDWNLVPGKEYTLKYRLLVFEGDLTKEQADAAWYDFAEPPVVKSPGK